MFEELRRLLSAKDFDALAKSLKDADANELAAFFAELSKEDFDEVCRGLRAEDTADFLVRLEDSELKERIISALKDRELKEVMDEISVDDTLEIIEEMPTDVIRRIAEEDEILKLLEERNFVVLKPLLKEFNPTDLAAVLDEVPKEDVVLTFRLLPKELAAETFVEMSSDSKQALIRSLNDLELKAVMDELFLDDTVDLIEEMPANVVRRLLQKIPPEKRRQINEIMNYPDDSAGSIMTIEYIDLTEGMTVGDALKRIRRTGLKKETVYTCYVLDMNRKLQGVVTALDLMTSESEDVMITDIMDTAVICATTHTDKEDVGKLIEKYDLLAVPIVDKENRLVGIVTVDDAIDVIQEEAEEDFAKMNAMAPIEKPYLKTGVFEIWRSRIGWLMLLMISATFTGMIISSFEDALAVQVTLTAFIPMLMDSGGNSGSQASVTIIRALSTGEVEFGDILRVMLKELRVSVLCGFSLAAATFVKILLVDNLIMGKAVTVPVALVVCITLCCTIIIAKLIGCTLPMFAEKIGFDPAVMASPFITTIVDAVSLLIYFTVAKSILSI